MTNYETRFADLERRVAALEQNRNGHAPAAPPAFRHGDRVRFGRPNGEQRYGTIAKINARSFKVKDEVTGILWRVDKTLCHKAEEVA